jgi:hypothetical protein
MTQLVIEPPETRRLEVTGPDVQALVSGLRIELAVAGSLVIDSTEMLEEAQQVAGRILGVAAAIEDERVERVKPFLEVQRWLNSGYGQARDYLSGLVNDQGGIKDKILAFNAAERERAAKATADARAAQEKAALDAAAAAAAQLQEAHALAEQSQQAAQTGDPERAQALADEAVRKADTAHTTAANAVATFVPPVQAAKAKGVQQKWVADILDKAQAIQYIGEQIAKGDHTLLALLDFNQSALNTMAKLQKNAMAIPGIQARPFEAVSIRKQ